MNIEQRLDKMETQQQIILDRIDELTLAITRSINQEQENTARKFCSNQQKSDRTEIGLPIFAIGNRAIKTPIS